MVQTELQRFLWPHPNYLEPLQITFTHLADSILLQFL